MKTLLLFCAFSALTAVVQAQSVIVVQNDTSMHTHHTLNEAVAAASDGDYIYIPGGTFAVNNLTIDKRLNIIGAGHNSQATQATGVTILNGSISFASGSDYSMIQGVYITNDMNLTDLSGRVQSNIFISRCSMDRLTLGPYFSYGSSDAVENVLIKECVIRTQTDVANNSNHNVFENCILGSTVHNIEGGVQFANCIFLKENGTVLSTTNSGAFVNCVFHVRYRADLVFSNGNQPSMFQNCLFGCASLANQTAQDNFFFNCYAFNGDVKLLYESVSTELYSDEHQYRFAWNDTLQSGALDFSQLGIYGGLDPYKDGAIPMNPHVESIYVPSQTDGQGRLTIQVNVQAQDR